MTVNLARLPARAWVGLRVDLIASSATTIVASLTPLSPVAVAGAGREVDIGGEQERRLGFIERELLMTATAILLGHFATAHYRMSNRLEIDQGGFLKLGQVARRLKH